MLIHNMVATLTNKQTNTWKNKHTIGSKQTNKGKYLTKNNLMIHLLPIIPRVARPSSLGRFHFIFGRLFNFGSQFVCLRCFDAVLWGPYLTFKIGL